MMFMSMILVWLAVCLAFYVPAYVLSGLGLYSIAKRRGIQRPWLAWVPGVNLYTLGCVSDQYWALVRGKNKNKRTALLLLLILSLAAFCVLLAQAPVREATLVNVLLLLLPVFGATVALTVIAYMALYDLYVSCDPKHAVLYLVLSIVLSVSQPVCLFLCRKKDLGFPL